MQYVYHIMPKEMNGKSLVSLNHLKSIDKRLYEKYASKYEDSADRKLLMDRTIPKLDCLWNDTVHFTPLHPNHVFRIVDELGVNVPAELKFFKIPIMNLKGNRNAIYHYKKEYYEGPATAISHSNIDILKLDDYRELSQLPEDTKNYFIMESKKGNRFGMFHFVPHILSHGEVPIDNAEIISWNQNTD
ncbi:group-specific protein [Salinicoccus hispanicus]|uniref:group-specific protein n=1 Tax=Salinicoccus hispanicus TaxID=157225 RepID=UPI001FE6794D|nr:group-specific protein [Salinicoccus hispanicus]